MRTGQGPSTHQSVRQPDEPLRSWPSAVSPRDGRGAVCRTAAGTALPSLLADSEWPRPSPTWAMLVAPVVSALGGSSWATNCASRGELRSQAISSASGQYPKSRGAPDVRSANHQYPLLLRVTGLHLQKRHPGQVTCGPERVSTGATLME